MEALEELGDSLVGLFGELKVADEVLDVGIGAEGDEEGIGGVGLKSFQCDIERREPCGF